MRKVGASCEFMLSIMYLGLLGGDEPGSRVSQIHLNRRGERIRATEHAPRDRFYLLERPNGLVEIVERGAFVLSERCRGRREVDAGRGREAPMSTPSPRRMYIN